MEPPPPIGTVREVRASLGNKVLTTPLFSWQPDPIRNFPADPASLELKLELFQYSGSFKVRGALNNMMKLPSGELEKGVTGVSAGNHAIALAYAARSLGTTAKVMMPETADPYRIQKCRELGGETILVKNVHEAFEEEKRVRKAEGRTFVHPFNGARTVEGTATVGVEMTDQASAPLDVLIVPIGGGGLAAGIASAVKQVWPACEVYGVEPVGADAMKRSFRSGKPEPIEHVDTIADSLGAPYTEAYTLAICQQNLSDLVQVTDDHLRNTMRFMYDTFKLAVEPAGAASLAAATGPLKERVKDKRSGIIVCGTNMGLEKHREYLA